MVTHEVILNNKRTKEIKRVLVDARDKTEACKKATGLQSFPALWLEVITRVESSQMKSRFQHKGLAKRS